MKLISWNINGIRSIAKKGLVEFMLREQADVYCFQETKARPDQLDDTLKSIPGYTAYFCSALRPGYSGTATYTRTVPQSVQLDMDSADTDGEGRIILTKFDDFYLFNVYFPNGGSGPERLAYKLKFYATFLEKIDDIRQAGHHIVFCGDINTAHQAIDLARPKANEQVSGFLRIERDWIDTLIAKGYVDTFRLFTPDPGHYSWWDYKSGARQRNVGWRIDYFFCDQGFVPRIKHAGIMPHIMGSDHCPVCLEIA